MKKTAEIRELGEDAPSLLSPISQLLDIEQYVHHVAVLNGVVLALLP